MNACQSIFHQYIDSSGMITSNPTWTIDIMRSLLRPLLISPFSASLPLLTTIFSAYNSFIIGDYLMSIQATLISIPKTILAALGVIVQHLLFILLLLIDNYYCIYRQSSLLLVATQKVYQFISLSLQSPFTFSNKSSGLFLNHHFSVSAVAFWRTSKPPIIFSTYNSLLALPLSLVSSI